MQVEINHISVTSDMIIIKEECGLRLQLLPGVPDLPRLRTISNIVLTLFSAHARYFRVFRSHLQDFFVDSLFAPIRIGGILVSPSLLSDAHFAKRHQTVPEHMELSVETMLHIFEIVV